MYLSNGNGTLNAFAAQSGWTNNYVVLSNELFANLRNDNREGTRFILGHEIAHIRLHHVALWYQLVLCYSQLIPILGPTLSRLREYSCDRNGAALEPKGELGLILLTAGRYAADTVRASELVDQGRHLGGFWVGISQLPRSHPWTVRRIWRLHQLGLFGPADTAGQAHHASGRRVTRSPTIGASRAHSQWGIAHLPTTADLRHPCITLRGAGPLPSPGWPAGQPVRHTDRPIA